MQSARSEDGQRKLQGTERSSTKKALASEMFPIEVAQLLNVFARIEMRRQARLRANNEIL